MKCAENAKLLYLYDESSEEEQRLVKEHIQSCASCAALFQQILNDKALIQSISHSSTPDFPSALTERILNQLEKHKTVSETVSVYLDEMFLLFTLRNVFAAFSIGIVVFFITETNMASDDTYPANDHKYANANIVLNTAEFMEQFKKYRNDNSSVLSCLQEMTSSKQKCPDNKEKIYKRLGI